jgi:DNA-directed RNA polymerase subunit K/omega
MRTRARSGTGRQTRIIDRLAKKFGRYALVAGVARRARDLKERIDSTFEPSDGGLINRAIGEIARGSVRIRAPEAEEEEEE